MAGHGPAPKHSRSRSNEPARGEWRTLPSKVEKATLPNLPKRSSEEGKWTPRTISTWKLLRADPATLTYGPGQIAYAIDTIYLYDEVVTGESTKWDELRLRMDGLALTDKGKRDARLRIARDEVSEARANRSGDPSTRERMAAVDTG